MKHRSNPYVPLNRKINDVHEFVVNLRDSVKGIKHKSPFEKRELKTLEQMGRLCAKLYVLANKL